VAALPNGSTPGAALTWLLTYSIFSV